MKFVLDEVTVTVEVKDIHEVEAAEAVEHLKEIATVPSSTDHATTAANQVTRRQNAGRPPGTTRSTPPMLRTTQTMVR